MESKKLSVISVTYKDPKGIQTTIDSLKPLLEQKSFPHSWEHVIVDSSPEETMQVLKLLPQSWPLKHVVKPAKGIYTAMNEAIEAASGEYLWFLNGGDALAYIDTLEKFIDILEKNADLYIVSGAVNRVRDGKFQYCWKPKFKQMDLNLLGSNGICHQGMIYRKKTFEIVGNYSTEFKQASDYEHHWKVYFKKIKVQFSNDVLASFDVSGLGGTQVNAGYEEIAKIHIRNRKNYNFFQYLLNQMLLPVHREKVLILKRVQKTEFAEYLRPFWLFWKRYF